LALPVTTVICQTNSNEGLQLAHQLPEGKVELLALVADPFGLCPHPSPAPPRGLGSFGRAVWRFGSFVSRVLGPKPAYAGHSGLGGLVAPKLSNITAVRVTLEFRVQPAHTTPGGTIPEVQVAYVTPGSDGDVVATEVVNRIHVSIGTNPGEGTLSGTKTQDPSLGIATFDDLSIDNVGSGYTLVADAINSDFISRFLGRRTIPLSATSTPFDVGLLQFREISIGGAFTCGDLGADSSAWCWGVNGEPAKSFGILGTFAPIATCGTFPCSTTPVAIPGGVKVTELSAGAKHVCAVLTVPVSGLVCWGRGNSGQLGNGATDSSATPVPVATGGVAMFGVSAGGLSDGHTCAVAGTAYCWGANGSGQLGDNSTTNRLTPVAVQAPAGVTFASISAGFAHTCGVSNIGDIYCWGRNFFGQLGDGTNTGSLTPVLVAGEHTWVAVSAGNEQTCAITRQFEGTGGEAFCWGRNDVGQLGSGTSGGSSNVPVAVSTTLTFVSIGTSGFHSCGLTQAGAAYCWGRNDNGQLGTGSFSATSTCTLLPGGAVPCEVAPVAVTGGHAFTMLDAHGVGDHVCGLAIESAVPVAYCWGRGQTGQLGNGATADRSTPVKVSGQ